MSLDNTNITDADAAKITRVEVLAYELTVDDVMSKN